MGVHILLMNLVAPIVALAAAGDLRLIRWRGASMLAAATVAQLAMLWSLHSPIVLAAAASSAPAEFIIQALLLATALWFWLAVLAQRGTERWRALLALLLTGKLFCLLAALLVFAPRHLYPAIGAAGHTPAHVRDLTDQQLAGLLMIVVCPLTYVAAAVVIAARWLREMAVDDDRSGERYP
jgi:putative membrane protein